MKYLGLGSSFCAALLGLAAGCGGKSEGQNSGVPNASPTEAGLPMPSEAVDAGVTPRALEAGTSAASGDVDALPPRDAGAVVVPIQTDPPAPSTTPVAGTATSAPMTPPLTPSPPVEEGPPTTIDWSVLQAPEGCLVGTALGAHDEQCKFEVSCDGKAFFSSCMWTGLGYECSCRDGSSDWNVYAQGNDLLEVCQASLDFCRAPGADELPPSECVPGGGGGNEDSCQATRTCTRSQQFDSGVVATVEDEETTECQFFVFEEPAAEQTGAWECTCMLNGQAYGAFYAPGLVPTVETCVNAQHLCGKLDELVLGETTRCDAAQESFTQSACSSRSSCLVAATIDGGVVHVKDDLSVSCSAVSEDEWSCDVYGPFGPSTVTLGAPESAVEACRDVVAETLLLIAPQVSSEAQGAVDAGPPAPADAGRTAASFSE
jgi:hypothetical protein